METGGKDDISAETKRDIGVKGELLVLTWIFGVALARDWWVLVAILFPPYAWYETAIHIIEKFQL